MSLHVFPIERDQIEPIIRDTKSEEGGNHVLMYGPPGTGKTTMSADPDLHLPGQQVFHTTLTDEQPAAELWGHFIKKGDEHIWRDGPASLAWKTGGVLVINEIQKMSQDVCDFLHVLLDDPTVARHNNVNGECLRPAPGFRCFASFNGTLKQIPDAVLDRFALRFPVDMPSTAMFNSLPPDVAQIARDQYKSSAGNPKGPSLTFRTLRNFSYFRRLIGAEAAAYTVTGYTEGGKSILDALRGYEIKMEKEVRTHILGLPSFSKQRAAAREAHKEGRLGDAAYKTLLDEIDYMEHEVKMAADEEAM